MADVSTTNSTSATNTSTTTSTANPKATLDKDAFLKLLLVELQHQDPTDPMDSDKMLTQTSQLSALEMQQNTNTTMQQMVQTMQLLSNTMTSSMNMSVVGAIGKMAIIDDNTVKLTDPSDTIAMKIYIPQTSNDKGIVFKVYDSAGNAIRTVNEGQNKVIQEGNYNVTWDGKKDDGSFAGVGNYTVKAEYTNENGGNSTAAFGTYRIEAIKFENGIAKAKIGGEYVIFTDIKELTA